MASNTDADDVIVKPIGVVFHSGDPEQIVWRVVLLSANENIEILNEEKWLKHLGRDATLVKIDPGWLPLFNLHPALAGVAV